MVIQNKYLNKEVILFYIILLLSILFALMLVIKLSWESAIIFATVLLFLPIFFIKGPIVLFALLVMVSFLTKYFELEIRGVTLRLEHVLVVVLFLILVLQFLGRQRKLYKTSIDLPIIGYLSINVISSLINSPDLKMSLQRCGLILIVLLAYFVTVNLIDDNTTLKKAIFLLLLFGVLESVFGIISFILYPLGINLGSVADKGVGSVYVHGTLREANIFGSTIMSISLIFLVFFSSPYYKPQRKLLGLGLLITIVALVLSYSRGAWGGFIVGFLVLLYLRKRKILTSSLKKKNRLSRIFIIIICIFLVFGFLQKFWNFSISDMYVKRFTNFFAFGPTTTGFQRITQQKYALVSWQRHPILGNGTDTFALSLESAELPEDWTRWIGNPFVQALHDTGTIGFFIFSSVLIIFLRTIISFYRRTESGLFRIHLEAMIVGFFGLLVAYQVTSVFWFSYVWIFMGLSMVILRLGKRDYIINRKQNSNYF